jgi:hypothetical protein
LVAALSPALLPPAFPRCSELVLLFLYSVVCLYAILAIFDMERRLLLVAVGLPVSFAANLFCYVVDRRRRGTKAAQSNTVDAEVQRNERRKDVMAVLEKAQRIAEERKEREREVYRAARRRKRERRERWLRLQRGEPVEEKKRKWFWDVDESSSSEFDPDEDISDSTEEVSESDEEAEEGTGREGAEGSEKPGTGGGEAGQGKRLEGEAGPKDMKAEGADQ